MNLKTAQHYAAHLSAWLAPYCHRLEIAGSIRRARPNVNDVDILCIPKVTENRDMFSALLGRTNHCLEFLQHYVAEKNPAGSKIKPPFFLSGGEKEGKQVMLQLPKCQLDIFFADEVTWSTRLLCRTGSKEHNIWLAQRALDRDMQWKPYEGLVVRGVVAPLLTEAAIYGELGLSYIEPEKRELPWLTKHIDSGL